jgi:hypothetical protein
MMSEQITRKPYSPARSSGAEIRRSRRASTGHSRCRPSTAGVPAGSPGSGTRSRSTRATTSTGPRKKTEPNRVVTW